MVIRRALRAVVLHRQRIDRPRAGRITRVTHRDIEMVVPIQTGREAHVVERQHNVHEATDHLVVDTTRISDRGASLSGIGTRADDGRRIPVESVEVDDARRRRAIGVIHAQNIVDGLEHVSVAHAQRLIGRFDGELVTSVGETLIVEVESFETQVQHWIGLGLLVRRNGLALPGLGAGECAVDAGLVIGPRAAIGVAVQCGVDLVGLRRGVGAHRRRWKRAGTYQLERHRDRARCRDASGHGQSDERCQEERCYDIAK